MRTCTKCGGIKPVEEFPSYRSKKNGGKRYRRRMCRPCCNEYQREWANRNPDRISAHRHAYYQRNKIAANARTKAWYDSVGGAQRWLWYRYKLTVEAFEAMLEEQEYRCAICRRHMDELELAPRRRRPIVVDHNRKCCPGKTSCGQCVRGLLCDGCNHGLGSFRDNPEALRAAIDYINRS